MASMAMAPMMMMVPVMGPMMAAASLIINFLPTFNISNSESSTITNAETFKESITNSVS